MEDKMGLKAGPYENAKEARIALTAAGYMPACPEGRKPDKWVHPTKPAKFAIQILKGNQAKIVPYPNLKRLDYRISSDAERAGQGFRPVLSRSRPVPARGRVRPRSPA